MPPEERRRGYPLLGVLAYVIVPGERRVRAARHFRKAALEAALGAKALIRTEERTSDAGGGSRERIDIE